MSYYLNLEDTLKVFYYLDNTTLISCKQEKRYLGLIGPNSESQLPTMRKQLFLIFTFLILANIALAQVKVYEGTEVIPTYQKGADEVTIWVCNALGNLATAGSNRICIIRNGGVIMLLGPCNSNDPLLALEAARALVLLR